MFHVKMENMGCINTFFFFFTECCLFVSDHVKLLRSFHAGKTLLHIDVLTEVKCTKAPYPFKRLYV